MAEAPSAPPASARPVSLLPGLLREPVVLMYHGFTRGRRAEDPENLFVDVDRFEEQLGWLLAQGWVPLDLDAYLALRRGGRRPAARTFLVTIDDGFTSVRDLAMPVLERLGVPAVLYVPSELVGSTARWLPRPADEPLLDAEALRQVHASPMVELGLHGADHTAMHGLGPSGLEHQVRRAHDTLADVLGSGVRSFAYPFGCHDARARSTVAASGFEIAFSVFDDVGTYAVSRIDVNATDTLASFRLKVQLPHYRRWWAALDRAPLLRRQVQALTTRVSRRVP